MDETTRVDQWLYATLTGSALFTGIPVHQAPAPSTATYPLVLFQHQGSADIQSSSAARIMVSGLWLIRAVTIDSESFAPLQTMADNIDTVLHRASGTAGSVTVASCVRQQPFRDADVTDGRHYRHLGAIFRIVAHTT